MLEPEDYKKIITIGSHVRPILLSDDMKSGFQLLQRGYLNLPEEHQYGIVQRIMVRNDTIGTDHELCAVEVYYPVLDITVVHMDTELGALADVDLSKIESLLKSW